MKVIIQIPAFNEVETLPETLADLPRSIAGVDVVEWLVIDDGSTDGTAEIARAHGVDHVVTHETNQGLARAFMTGLDACLRRGADIIVNTDADNQYNGADVPKLVAPILEGRAEIVIGARPIAEIEDFSRLKKYLQRLGSWVVRKASNTEVEDATSGFRALSHSAAIKINLFDRYTYTLETIIQAGRRNAAIVSVPIRTNPQTRPSRLVRSIPSYVLKSARTILRVFLLYRPMQTFSYAALAPGGLSLLLFARWMFLFLFEDPTRARVPSLILALALLLIALAMALLGLIAHLISVNRRLVEEIAVRQRASDYANFNDRD